MARYRTKTALHKLQQELTARRGKTMNVEDQKRAFLALLDEKRDEQSYQSFMEKHTRFIPRSFEQNHGIHLGLVLRKLSLDADYKTDFFFFSKSTVNWNAVFIEVEKPSSRFFKRNTNEFHSDFLSALQQVNQWKAWFLNESNKASFLSTVSAIQVPLSMTRNPTNYKYVLVLGRRSEFCGNEDRRNLVMANKADDFDIMTFDSLAEGLAGKCEVTIGSRHNQYIDVLIDDITHPSLYAWMEPTQLRVSKALQDKLANGPRSNRYIVDENGNRIEALAHAAPKVRVR